MYPLRFHPIYKERIWGGTALAERFGRVLPAARIGESWDVSCHPSGMSIIANGPWMGQKLDEIAKHYGRQLVGSSLRDDAVRKFPLLMKLLDAHDSLSVQVHPGDDYAAANENGELGKSELWYILAAKPGARIVYGVAPGTSKERFAAALTGAESIEPLLSWVEVAAGQMYDIPAGLVHALGEGVVVAEIQQNSDTTYRVYDYGRVDDSGYPRELHVGKALDVITFGSDTAAAALTGVVIEVGEGLERRLMAAGKYFAVELLKLGADASWTHAADGKRFAIVTCTDGIASLAHASGTMGLAAGDSCLLPATMGRYSVSSAAADCTLMISYVPDFEFDVVKPLRAAGYDPDTDAPQDAKEKVSERRVRGPVGGLE